MTLKRMDNVLIVVDDLEAAKAFFIELGLELEGETTVEGPLVGSLIGLKDVRATLAMMRTPDGQGIELDKFHTPNAIRFGPVDAPVNTLGIRRIMFAVDDIDAVVARMRAPGAGLIGDMQYEDTYRLAYIRGPEGIIVALAEQLALARATNASELRTDVPWRLSCGMSPRLSQCWTAITIKALL
jgi:catechol 2,3-dioxygenase-like lactoylglutathione lyase family enzyme